MNKSAPAGTGEGMSRAAYIVAILGACWLLMQAVHELGHVLAAWAGGGTVERVVLHPLTISRTDVAYDSHPLLTVWAGPVVGALLPLAWCRLNSPNPFVQHTSRFLAGFCLIANGVYLAIGSWEGIGDAGELVRHGTPIVMLWLFGAATIPAGFYLWHRLGRHLGFTALPIQRKHALAAWGGFIAIVLIECGLNGS